VGDEFGFYIFRDGGEERFLVCEVMIKCARRRARIARDLGERDVGEAEPAKGRASRREQRFARRGGRGLPAVQFDGTKSAIALATTCG
jgi:hypothetical protein